MNPGTEEAGAMKDESRAAVPRTGEVGMISGKVRVGILLFLAIGKMKKTGRLAARSVCSLAGIEIPIPGSAVSGEGNPVFAAGISGREDSGIAKSVSAAGRSVIPAVVSRTGKTALGTVPVGLTRIGVQGGVSEKVPGAGSETVPGRGKEDSKNARSVGIVSRTKAGNPVFPGAAGSIPGKTAGRVSPMTDVPMTGLSAMSVFPVEAETSIAVMAAVLSAVRVLAGVSTVTGIVRKGGLLNVLRSVAVTREEADGKERHRTMPNSTTIWNATLKTERKRLKAMCVLTNTSPMQAFAPAGKPTR